MITNRTEFINHLSMLALSRRLVVLRTPDRLDIYCQLLSVRHPTRRELAESLNRAVVVVNFRPYKQRESSSLILFGLKQDGENPDTLYLRIEAYKWLRLSLAGNPDAPAVVGEVAQSLGKGPVAQ